MAPKKPSCQYRYVDGMFVIWPHGMDDLQKFNQHLNNIHKNQVHDGSTNKRIAIISRHLVMKKQDGSLEHSIYREATRTDLYLHAKSHHHPLKNHFIADCTH